MINVSRTQIKRANRELRAQRGEHVANRAIKRVRRRVKNGARINSEEEYETMLDMAANDLEWEAENAVKTCQRCGGDEGIRSAYCDDCEGEISK